MADSIFPFIQPQIYTDADVSSDNALPLYSDVEWDFVTDKPVFVRGEPNIVTGLPAVMSWAWRALHQERFVNDIYTWNYGSEIPSLIGQQWQQETKLAEAARYLKECLVVSPYITDVTNIVASFEGGLLTISCVVETIYGVQTLEVVS